MNKQTFITIVIITFAALMISLAQCTSSSESPENKVDVTDEAGSPLLISFFRTYTLANGYSFDQMVVKCGLLRTELSSSLRSNAEDLDWQSVVKLKKLGWSVCTTRTGRRFSM